MLEPLFCQTVHDWNLERMDEFLLRLQTKVVSKDHGDRMVMLLAKSLYSYLMLRRQDLSFQKILFEPNGTNKSGIFLGRDLGQDPSHQTIEKEMLNLEEYFLCKNKEESADHLLLYCTKRSSLWRLVLSLFGVEQVMLASSKEALLS